MNKPEPRVLLAFAAFAAFAAIVAIVAIVVFLGVNFVAVRFSNRELAPFWDGPLRFAAATVLLFAVVGIRRGPLPRGRALVGAALFGALAFGVNFALLYWGLLHVRAALASVIFATILLLTLVMATAIGQERFRWRGLAGGCAALAGTGVVFFVQLRLNVPAASLVAVALAAIAAALSGIVVRGFPRSHPIGTNAVGMAVGAAILFAASRLARRRRAARASRAPSHLARARLARHEFHGRLRAHGLGAAALERLGHRLLFGALPPRHGRRRLLARRRGDHRAFRHRRCVRARRRLHRRYRL